MTSPANERFAQVIANRVWKRLMGRGLVEPVDDWEKGEPTHPELLRYLGRELVRSGYDLKQLTRLILNSHAYQRAADPDLKEPDRILHRSCTAAAGGRADRRFAVRGRRQNDEHGRGQPRSSTAAAT